MLFNSLEYLFFLPIVVILHFLLPQKIRPVFLLGASYFFYSCWSVKYSLLMGLSTIITFLTGIGIEASGTRQKKLWVFFCFVVNLGILFFFKYFNFTVELLDYAANFLPLPTFSIQTHFLLPVGISFYTFQALGYTIDVYRKDISAEHNFIKYALFVSFFPQLVAGPIERSTHLLPQIKKGGSFTFEHFRAGLIYIFFGYFLKLMIADRAAMLVNGAFAHYNRYSSPVLLAASVAFTLQIYCDFYSYSVIAKGSARIMGYELMDNFKEPFFSKSIIEFWRRWHISLSTWFKDYLYIPLGGNRRGTVRKCFNLFVVFLTSGLWHGANLTFVLWGALHGFCNVVENIFISRGLRWKDNWWCNLLRRIVTFSIVVFGFVIFRAKNITQAREYLHALFTAGGGNFFIQLEEMNFGRANFYVLVICLVLLFVIDLLKYHRVNVLVLLKDRTPLPLRWLVYLLCIFSIFIFGIYGPGFSESQFIYFQF